MNIDFSFTHLYFAKTTCYIVVIITRRLYMSKINIMNYVVSDLANRFNFSENVNTDRELVDLVEECWQKKHVVLLNKNAKFHYKPERKGKLFF
jgi:hypothetical protein